MDLSQQKRTIYITIGGLIAATLIGFLMYRFFIPAVPALTPERGGVSGKIPELPGGGSAEIPPGEEIPVPEVPAAGETAQMLQLTDFPVLSPSLNKNEDRILFYKKEGGDLLAYDFDGATKEKISNITVVGMIEAVWSPARERAAVFYLDRGTIKSFLHIGTSSVAVLPQNIKSFAWSPDGKSLAYLLLKGKAVELVIGDGAGRNARTVFSSSLTDASIAWAASDRITFQTAPSGLAEGYLFAYSRQNGTFSALAGPRNGLQTSWSPDGTRFLAFFTGAGGQNPPLEIRNAAGVPLLGLNLATFKDKCLWTPDEVFCAVPQSLPADAVLPDDYLRGEINTQDNIFTFNTKTEQMERIDMGNFDITNIVATKDKKTLFFIDRRDGTLWRARIR